MRASSSLPHEQKNADVIVVGAGPIGLLHAIGIKKLFPHYHILVLEKYEEYQRSHTLIVEPANIAAFIDALEDAQIPELADLLARLKKDQHIRTNELEAILKKLAQDSEIEIKIETVTKENIKEQLIRNGHTPKLIIGADGTHSTVNAACFPKDNQVKHEFDYVMQFRFDVEGEYKPDLQQNIDLYQLMARKGLVANEYVGHFKDGTTPVTMQMMIKKEEFERLKKVTSKNPLKPYTENATEINDLSIDDVPDSLRAFLDAYLITCLKQCNKVRSQVNNDSVRISVNEAPATHAKQIYCVNPALNNVPILLVGDAGLGLSYFKGLNAGIQSTVKFLQNWLQEKTWVQALRQPDDNSQLIAALESYQEWFKGDFAPKKIKSVADFSKLRIRSLMSLMSWLAFSKGSSVEEDAVIYQPLLKAHLDFRKHSLGISDCKGDFRVYPHREHDIVKLGQFSYVPLTYSFKRMGKVVVDFFKPYKSLTQLGHDFRQPLVGITNFGMGLLKLVVGLFTLSPKRFADGFISIGRGLVEIATTALLPVKLITRGLTTAIVGRPKFEEGKGVQKIADYQHAKKTSTYRMLARCHDLHRKFSKAEKQGQLTDINAGQEAVLYQAAFNEKSKDATRAYISLFIPKAKETPLGEVIETMSFGNVRQ